MGNGGVGGGDAADAGRRLYFKSLREMLLQEEVRLKTADFTDLLGEDAMHKALMAICFEVTTCPAPYPLPPSLYAEGRTLHARSGVGA